ncbi:metallophosphoesterase [Candidatus Woesearchaeota archaeon]|nr:metallophosphoesterase [Candidatus Woesearchaeota archaeon]
MGLNSELEIIDLCLYFRKQRILVVSDIHMGYEEALNKQGVLVPRFQFVETVKRLENVLKAVKIDTIVINGDLKHEFGTISETEWRHTLRILDLMFKYAKKIVLLKGNHDTILKPIAAKRNLEVRDYYVVDDYYICHGHVLPDESNDKVFKKAKYIIIGHEHPAVTLSESGRFETYKCFLIGNWKRKKLIVMPSFNLVTEGTDILKEEILSPFLKQKLSNFEVYIVSDKVYFFGKLKNLKSAD